ALKYYQRSLISVVKDFNDPDIFSNPAVDSSLFDIRLLENLKSKARALELLARQQGDIEEELKTINKSLETIELALHLIRRIRNSYPTEESRLYLAENEKETYLFAVHVASVVFNMTGDNRMVCKMYSIAQEAKVALLRNDLTANELLYSSGIPDSIIGRRNTLVANISAYNNLIFTEAEKINPDSIKISFWKDAIFDMTREIEKITAGININYPQYHELLMRTEPLELSVIQKNLGRDVTLIDYLLSNHYENSKRDLYTFLITRDKITFYSTGLDSSFLPNAGIIRNMDQDSLISRFRHYTGALNYMFNELIGPVEQLFAGNKLIIIPDEEMEWLPFEAFLKHAAAPEQTDYEGLQYLINEFTISYAYSSSFISGGKNRNRGGVGVYAFSPDYGGMGTLPENNDSLPGATQEIGSIYRWFRGKRFTGDEATETHFRELIREPAIFHLAMHSVTDTSNSKYSYLLFGNGTDNNEDGKLYNYEISLTRMSSPMVVLSACNSGTGTLYHGEGLMSLARGFILAGASSVIRTSWEVNDETSAKIISRFYYYLSKGKYKDEALRQAKLDYIKAAPPAFSSPWYWAAYEILGDNAPVASNKGRLLVVAGISLFIALTILLIYLRRRNNFSEGSL
ncbi:MAG: CHAT domain-containing protein, partial [Bacteroidales bacterium]|nr:CHAT domain-containing protein [Bacteroidales bacterium]